MPSLKYYRPKTLEEAVALLEQGVPLAGGTALTPGRLRLEAVVDLQDLSMAALERKGDLLEVGAGCTLQQIVEADSLVPTALVAACRAEAAWNLRNMATLGGTIVAGDGRSPVLAAAIALEAEVYGLPRDEWKPIDAYLDTRGKESGHRLLTAFRWYAGAGLRSAQVGRSPMDWPLVSVTLGRTPAGAWRVVLGGHGPKPIRVPEAEDALAKGDISGAVRLAEKAYSSADDAWATSEYRSQVAGVLLRRLAAEDKASSEVREPKDPAPSGARNKAPREPRERA